MQGLRLALTWASSSPLQWQGEMALALLAVGIFFATNRWIWVMLGNVKGTSYVHSLQRWGLQVTLEDLPAIQQSLWRYWGPILFLSTLGAASCLLMFPLLLAARSLLETGTLAWLTFMTSELWLPQFYFATTLGLGMGYLTGVWWVKRRTRRSLTYADLEPRRLSNYRSHWFFWLQVLFIALYGGLFVQAAPLLDTLSQHFWLPGGLIIALMIGALVLGEGYASRIASAPRLLVAPDPQSSRHLDDMVRAQTIGLVQCQTLITITWLGMALMLFYDNAGGPVSSLYDLLLTFLVFLGIACWAGVGFLSGRLGGKQTGWPWTEGEAR